MNVVYVINCKNNVNGIKKICLKLVCYKEGNKENDEK